MQYEARFKDKNAAGFVFQRLREAYKRANSYVPCMLKVSGTSLLFQAESPRPLEVIASKANLRYQLSPVRF